MKKRLLACLLCLVVFLICSCKGQSYGILKYQDKKINAECTLNGEYKISIKKDGDLGEISFLSPPALSYISFEINKDVVVGHAGELEIPLESESVRGILALKNIFSLSEECLCTASSLGECTFLEFSTEYGTYRLTLGKNGLPSSVQIICADYRFDISIDAISVS